ncbi:MAG: type IX secretion system sortase PorU [Bacteroidota bacterium]
MINRILLWLGYMMVCLPIFAQSFSDQSVLKDGDWYQIAISESGMYSLDRSFLDQLGINSSSIDPRNIRIFGNGGAMVPQLNSAPRHDDLVENAIQVVGEEDGSFDSGDEVRFYAEGPHVWQWNFSSQELRHLYHHYSDTNFYYLNIGSAAGKRIETVASEVDANVVIDKSQFASFHETDKENPLKSGRNWLGERFELTTERTFTFGVTEADPNGNIRLKLRVAARGDVQTYFTVRVGNQDIGTLALNATNLTRKEARYYFSQTATYDVSPSLADADDSLRVTLVYNRSGSTRTHGWLDWMEVSYDQRLDMQGKTARWFHLSDQVGVGQFGEVEFANFPSNGQVWDITDPTEVKRRAGESSGSTYSFKMNMEAPAFLFAFSEANRTPLFGRKINNQNLHGMDPVDYLIITHPDFREAADRLAAFHQTHYQRSTAIVYPENIFHEFSSGKQDVVAIRDFIRMMYLRSAENAPGFISLFGDGTYIYKNISQNLTNNSNFVPTYQSRDSWDPTDSYVSDDFFGMMEENEGFWGEASQIAGDNTYQVNTIDIPVGRLPVNTLEEANTMVDKIIGYATNPDGVNLGSWRNEIVLVADHKEGEGNIHVRQANGYTSQIEDANPCYNVEKIFMDNYKMEVSAGQESFPDGRDALLSAFDEGSLIINYTGHGGEQAWSNANILRNSDIDKMKNSNRYPTVVTATCEFGRYDDPDLTSGAELMTIEPIAGAISLFTTVRLVYSSPNETLNRNFYRYVFTFDSLKGRMPTMGEIMMRTKNATFPTSNLANINSRNFTLLGDPGLILNYPSLKARITHINDDLVQDNVTDSLQSLSLIKVSGQIEDDLGNVYSDFGGDMDVTVFDKPSRFTTRLSNYSFLWQKNRIFNGKTTVEEGTFEFEFVVPIDISYEDGKGKISLYFANQEIDGAGCYTNLHVGGTDENAIVDETGPEVELFINDNTWISGSMTSPNPYLYAEVRDDNGINTVGAGIGHEITAVLDEDFSQVFILNDFYTAKVNSFQEGTVRYQLRDLPEGEHELRIRVWDIANNSSEATTKFIVSSSATIALDRIVNAPNPFGDQTRFLIGHNQSGAELQVEVIISNLAGQVLKTLTADFFADGNNFTEMEWDGMADDGMPVSNGTYIYQVHLRNMETGQSVADTRKMVIVR